ncbi:phosphotransferase family protein [Gulosibacter molinativorax]|uniref:Phosphotransferase family protein n=1 Tax=Gulosibacter molinativorax TaxID=256821 RepID=A0ABT7CB97_9MICO|nr:phosphotransferase family protein [Gulosibacter molinativorax]MDJ1372476.1 phosphotransferase family protein [Gulosibacter molinativorax]QUY61947.1 Phosphotransferase enzyme family protein [Gulosibacter molinativorax]
MTQYRPTTSNLPSELPGLRLEEFAEWVADAHPELGRVTGARRLVGGHSNLSYIVETDNGRYVLRRPPLGHVMETAHDMRREFRVQAALGGTPVPVPQTRFYAAADTRNTGVDTEFYVMDFVEGTPFGDASVNADLSPATAHELSLETGRVLAHLHEVGPAEVGLADFGKPGGFLVRQANRWNKQLVASESREVPDTRRLGELLAASAPEDSGSAILHGDYKLNNTLVDLTGAMPRIAALLDWEMSTLGDPLTDLAVLGIYWRMSEIHPTTAEAFASPVDFSAGYASFGEVSAAYFAARSIPEPPHMPWYHALAAFKIAVITESLHYRFVTGQTVGDDFARMGEMTEPIAAEGLRAFSALDSDALDSGASSQPYPNSSFGA